MNEEGTGNTREYPVQVVEWTVESRYSQSHMLYIPQVSLTPLPDTNSCVHTDAHTHTSLAQGLCCEEKILLNLKQV